MVKMQGYIMVAILLFLQIFTLLGLYALESSRIAIKTNNEAIENNQISELINQVLKKIESNAEIYTPSCIINDATMDEIKSKPLSWWEQVSCAGNFQSIQYYYVVELLGKDACAQLHDAVAEYERITLFTITEKKEARLQQSTIIKPVIDTSTHCEQTVRQVVAGRQSWCIL